MDKDRNINIIEILESSNKVIKSNIDLLSKLYTEKTGRAVCRTCPSDVQYMILTLKNIYKMTQFAFKKDIAQYKDKKGDKTTISNCSMTDERAIEFIKTKPSRIELFKTFPKNWKDLIGGVTETEEEKDEKLQIEAEILASQEPTEIEELRDQLIRLSMKELREKYPNIKARSTKEMIGEVIKLEQEKQ